MKSCLIVFLLLHEKRVLIFFPPLAQVLYESRMFLICPSDVTTHFGKSNLVNSQNTSCFPPLWCFHLMSWTRDAGAGRRPAFANSRVFCGGGLHSVAWRRLVVWISFSSVAATCSSERRKSTDPVCEEPAWRQLDANDAFNDSERAASRGKNFSPQSPEVYVRRLFLEDVENKICWSV